MKKRHLLSAMETIIEAHSSQLNDYKNRRFFLNPECLYSEKEMYLHSLLQTFENKMNLKIHGMKEELKDAQSQIQKTMLDTVHTSRAMTREARFHLLQAMNLYDTKKKNEFVRITSLLDAYSPLKVMQRGFGILEQDTQAIHSVKEIDVNKPLTIEMIDGTVHTEVKEINEGENPWQRKN